jgi:FixJ family two-component response regulator
MVYFSESLYLQEIMSQLVTPPLISVVDDDHSVRESLQRLIRSVGFAVRVFASAEDFLKSKYVHETQCLILDVRMPGTNGFELHRQLRKRNCGVPVIFITAHGNEALRLQALKQGAVEYLCKPFDDNTLLNAIEAVLRPEVIKT